MDAHARPNILVIMSDEHAPMFSRTYGHPRIETPHLDALAAGGTLFEDAYCPSPLCVPSRAAFLAGKHVHRVGAWDNGAPFPSETVTFAHLLRAAGYEVALDGKMHFVGPDTLHGFERQLTRDAHREADAPTITGREWTDPHPAAGPRARGRIEGAGPGRADHLDFDDAVEGAALDWISERAPRGGRRRDTPWCLVAGFLAPHFPLVVPQPYFDRYYPDNVDLPAYPPEHLASQHPAHERVRRTFDLYGYTEEQIRVARAAYYGLVTYMDDKIGRLVGALRQTGQLQHTVVVYTSDHGELAGDHGLWWKNSFYEQASRVPLVVSWPEAPREVPVAARFPGAVSLLDLTRTLVDLAGAPDPGDLDGDSLLPAMRALGAEGPAGARALWKDEAIVEYYGHATNRPQRMLRAGRWKYAYYHGEPSELYDLLTDPQEFNNRAGEPEVAAVEGALRRRLLADWDPAAVELAARRSPRARQLIGRATGAGRRQH